MACARTIVVSAVCVAVALTGASLAGARNLDAFARCVSKNGATLYGATWCPHCARQEDLFGDAVRHLDIVDCDVSVEDAVVCLEAGVVGYPTWVFGDGTRQGGVLSLERLAGRTSCRFDAPPGPPAADDSGVLFIDVR